MKLTGLEMAAWLLYIAIHPLLLAFIVKRRAAGRFPILFSLLAFQTCCEPVLFLLHTHYSYYFYAYWITFPLQTLLRLAVTVDVVRAIPDIHLTSRETITSFTIVSVMVVSGCVFLAFRASQGWVPAYMSVFLGIERSVAIIWLLFPVLTFFLLGTMGIGLTARGQRVGLGNVMLAVLSLASTYALSRWPNSSVLIYALELMPSICVWLFLGWAVAGPEPTPFVLTNEVKAEYARLLQEYRF